MGGRIASWARNNKGANRFPVDAGMMFPRRILPWLPAVLKSDVRRKDYYAAAPAPDELWLRHLTVDEALPELDRFLHDRFVAGFTRVSVIHGKGAGTLREEVRRRLKKHPLVKSFQPGGRAGGGEGVTVVDFTDR
jgi:dsDNA-specific endonuclease/ATPase MutS2